jgi:hypothetical protein
MEEEILKDRKLLALGIFAIFVRTSSKQSQSESTLCSTWRSPVDWPLTGPALREPRPLPIAAAMGQKPPLHLEKNSLSIENKRRDKTDQDKAERIEERGKGGADERGEKT